MKKDNPKKLDKRETTKALGKLFNHFEKKIKTCAGLITKTSTFAAAFKKGVSTPKLKAISSIT